MNSPSGSQPIAAGLKLVAKAAGDPTLEGSHGWQRGDGKRTEVLRVRWRQVLRFASATEAESFVAGNQNANRTSGVYTLTLNAQRLMLQPARDIRGKQPEDVQSNDIVLADVDGTRPKVLPTELIDLDRFARGILNDIQQSPRVLESFEFIDLVFPSVIRGPFDSANERQTLVDRAKQSTGADFASTVVSGSRLIVGPEKSGAVVAVGNYLEDKFANATKTSLARFDSRGYRWMLFVSPVMAASLVFTWALPLSWLSTSAVFVWFAALMGSVAWPVFRRQVPFRHLFLRARTGSALFFFVIAFFATAYAAAALFDPDVLNLKSIGSARLGDAYFVATAITFTVGLLSETLHGIGLPIAHVQMIVFMTTIVTAVIAILNLERTSDSHVQS